MKKFLLKLASIAAALVVAFSPYSPTLRASADEQTTSVMQDLTECGVDVNDYPSKTVAELKASKEPFLQVIRIAESVTDELFIYVYQATDAEKEIEAVKVVVNFTKDPEDKTAKVYDLKLVSTEGVFDKYLVKGLKVLSLSDRYYSITSLMRKYDKSLGDDEKYGNQGGAAGTTDYVPEPVAQIWYAQTTSDGNREYAYKQVEVVIITDKFNGFIRYSDGFKLLSEPYTDSHFIAFTTNYKIEDLLSAEVYYEARAYEYSINYFLPEKLRIKVFKDEVISGSNYKKLTAGDKGNNEADSWFGHKYEWERIEKLSSFREAEGAALTDEAKTRLAEIQNTAGENGAWVLRFWETGYTEIHDPPLGATKNSTYYKTTRVSNVAILKLTFRTEGTTYTMGVVDSMVTPDTEPDGAHNETEWDFLFKQLKDGFNNLTKTLRGIGLAVGAIFAACIVGGIAYGIITLINWIRDAVHRRKK